MDPNAQTDIVLTVADCRNLLAALSRTQFNGLAEAEAGLQFAMKLRGAKLREIPQAPPCEQPPPPMPSDTQVLKAGD